MSRRFISGGGGAASSSGEDVASKFASVCMLSAEGASTVDSAFAFVDLTDLLS